MNLPRVYCNCFDDKINGSKYCEDIHAHKNEPNLQTTTTKIWHSRY